MTTKGTSLHFLSGVFRFSHEHSFIATGTPEDLMGVVDSYTGVHLRPIIYGWDDNATSTDMSSIEKILMGLVNARVEQQ